MLSGGSKHSEATLLLPFRSKTWDIYSGQINSIPRKRFWFVTLIKRSRITGAKIILSNASTVVKSLSHTFLPYEVSASCHRYYSAKSSMN